MGSLLDQFLNKPTAATGRYETALQGLGEVQGPPTYYRGVLLPVGIEQYPDGRTEYSPAIPAMVNDPLAGGADMIKNPVDYIRDPNKVTNVAADVGMLGGLLSGGVPRSALGSNAFRREVSDASGLFGKGAEKIKYIDDATGSDFSVVKKPGTANVSVLDTNVPEGSRGKGVGKALLARALEDHPNMQGQIHSKAAAVNAYNAGRRPYDMPDATIEDVFGIMDDMSSVNMVTTKKLPMDEASRMAVGKPKEAFGDWRWRSPGDVRSELGLTEVPGHVQDFGKFMAGQTEKAKTGAMTSRDIIKAFTITRSSIQRGAVDIDKVRAAGLDVAGTGKIRPEGAFSEWLLTPMGKQYLDAAEKGVADADSIANAVKVMAPFGRHTTDIPDALVTAAKGLDPDRAINLLAAGDTAGWREYAKGLRGIGSAKQGFVGSMLGEGSIPTLDARQIKLHTGKPTSAAQGKLSRKGWGDKAVDRLAKRQADMDLDLPKELEPYRQHLTHHTVWDKVSNEVTTHSDVIKAMELAANPAPISVLGILDEIERAQEMKDFVARGGA
jgi:predicted GNAT family acetyltransferase